MPEFEKPKTDISPNEQKGELSSTFDTTQPSDTLLQIRPSVARTYSDRSGKENAVASKGKKIGHRRVLRDGEVTYKKFETTQLMGSIQLGLGQSIGSMAGMPEDRDLLMKDFEPIISVPFTRDGALQKTPAHNYSEFRFRTYAPVAFFKFRQMFEIEESEFLVSLCSQPMIELSNPGASGSIFYITRDDIFICKTVQHKEAYFLRKLLPGYYMNLKQNPRTLLPKFFGLYCYSCNAKNVRMIVMNNLLPSELKMHQKFDLKGSTYKRKASKREREKNSPTFKDLDFTEQYPEGIYLQPEIYDKLMNAIQRDSRVLESYKIMDYSLLIGIHNLNLAEKEEQDQDQVDLGEDFASVPMRRGSGDAQATSSFNLERQGSVQYRDRTITHTTALESITMEVDASESDDLEDDVDTTDAGVKNLWGGIPARGKKDEPRDHLLLFIGIIDILQSYGMLKKAEHYWKSLVHDGDSVSVHRPSFYAKRFQDFMKNKVFKKMECPLKSQGSVKRSTCNKASVSKEMEAQNITCQSSNNLDVSSDKDAKETSVTVITIGESVNLPAVLQDRRKTSLNPQPISRRRSSSPQSKGDSSLKYSVVEKSEAITSAQSPISSGSGNEDRLDTGSIITMTSDERVQIYVPSPQTTPYNTITNRASQIEQGLLFGGKISTNHLSSSREDTTPPPFSYRSVFGDGSGTFFRSVTPLNQEQTSQFPSATKITSAMTSHYQLDSHLSGNPISTQETSLEMIKISINSSGNDSPTKVVKSNESFEITQTEDTGRTMLEELPSLPHDDEELPKQSSLKSNEEPISLSHINLEEASS